MELLKFSTKKIIIIFTLATGLYAAFHRSPPDRAVPITHLNRSTPTKGGATHPTTVLKTGFFTTTFTQVAEQAGLPRTITYEYLSLFSNLINFSHNTHPNDSFTVLYSVTQPTPHLIAAELSQRHHHYQAVYYANTAHPGYYQPNGESITGRYLIAPLTYKYISSPYSLHRRDPITHRMQPHYGVDYAAHIGTPIHSVGYGRVIYKGWIHGYGNTVKIRYNRSTYGLYAHLSHFARIHDGQYVNKGAVIGFVGMTGWATGPHLHFGWYVHNKPTNPVLRPFVATYHIPPQQLRAFKHYYHTVLAQLHPKKPRQLV